MCRCVAVYDYVKRHARVHGGQKRVSDAPGQMVQTAVGFLRVGLEMEAWVPCQSSLYPSTAKPFLLPQVKDFEIKLS